jgi:hypothetical protein
MNRSSSSRSKRSRAGRVATAALLSLSLAAVGLGAAGSARAVDAYFPPVASDDVYSMVQGGTLIIGAPGVLANDQVSDGGSLSVDHYYGAIDGELTQSPADGSFVYIPDPSFVGQRTFSYDIVDSESSLVSAVANVTIIVTAVPAPVKHAPAAVDDNYSITQGGTLQVVAPGLLANDSDPDGDPVGVFGFQGKPAEVTVGETGDISYQPAPGFVGVTSFTYRITDGELTSNWATVTITVDPGTAVDPVANPDSYTTPKNTPLVVSVPGVLVNDSDPTGHIFDTDDLTGEIAMNYSGDFVYTPATDFVGIKIFHYTMSDGTLPSNSALVTITVTDPVAPPVTPGVTTTDPSGADIPAITKTAVDGSLAFTGAQTGWLAYPGLALLLIGGAGIWFAVRRTRTRS